MRASRGRLVGGGGGGGGGGSKEERRSAEEGSEEDNQVGEKAAVGRAEERAEMNAARRVLRMAECRWRS